jgi:hypothetical protein
MDLARPERAGNIDQRTNIAEPLRNAIDDQQG